MAPDRLRRGSAWPRRRAECPRSEEHTSELQSHLNLVCRLLLEKKNVKINYVTLISPSPRECHEQPKAAGGQQPRRPRPLASPGAEPTLVDAGLHQRAQYRNRES